MKITIHPLFAAVGIFSAVFGGLPVFLIYTLTALLHECGHIFYARKIGYECSKIKIMPYGAAAVCNLEGISAADELRLALAGPAVNFALCVAVAGLWWFLPSAYAYTDTLMQANLVMLVINLLPAYPLDGGRAAKCLLIRFVSSKAAVIVLRVAAVIFAAALCAVCFVWFNFSCLIFAAFLIFSAFEKPPQAVKINFATDDKLKRGLEVKYVLVSPEITYKKAISLLDDKKYIILRLENGEELTQDELYDRFTSCSIYDKVFKELSF
ncbi:MAG: hypothetical protein LUI60_00970 [Clostridia bacterium]|nr:hypothetical protein [Clostridia bacterium]